LKIQELRGSLKRLLKNENISSKIIQPWELLRFSYVEALEVRFYTESYFIKKKKNNWITFHCERGLESEKREFSNEEEACRFFYNWIVNRNA